MALSTAKGEERDAGESGMGGFAFGASVPGTARDSDRGLARETAKVLAYLLNDPPRMTGGGFEGGGEFHDRDRDRDRGDHKREHPTLGGGGEVLAGSRNGLTGGLRAIHMLYHSRNDSSSSSQTASAAASPPYWDEDTIEAAATALGVLEMMFRLGVESPAEMYSAMGSSFMFLLLHTVERCLGGEAISNGGDAEPRKGTLMTSDSPRRICVRRSAEILSHFASVPSLRAPMANLPGLLGGILSVLRACDDNDDRLSASGEESESESESSWRVLALRSLADLAQEKETREAMASHPGLLDSLLLAASSESYDSDSGRRSTITSRRSKQSRKLAIRALMDLTTSEINCSLLGSNIQLVGVMLDALRYGSDDNAAVNYELWEYASATVVNVVKSGSVTTEMFLVNSSLGGGSACYMSGLVHAAAAAAKEEGGKTADGTMVAPCFSSTPLVVASSCLDAIRRLIADDRAAEICCSQPDLVQALGRIAAMLASEVGVGGSGKADGARNASLLAASAMTILSKHVKFKPPDPRQRQMHRQLNFVGDGGNGDDRTAGDGFDSNDGDDDNRAQDAFLSSLAGAILGSTTSVNDLVPSSNTLTTEIAARLGEAMANLSAVPANRTQMARSSELLCSVLKLSAMEGDDARCALAALRTLRNLIQDGEARRQLSAYEVTVDALINLMLRTEFRGSKRPGREIALGLARQMAADSVCQDAMRRHQRLMVELAKMATRSWDGGEVATGDAVGRSDSSLVDRPCSQDNACVARDIIVLLMFVKDDRKSGEWRN